MTDSREVGPVTVAPVLREHIDAVASFLHEHLNARVPLEAWHDLLAPPWDDSSAPNSGFQLLSGGVIVGVYAAVYSRRRWIGEEDVLTCNLAAFCVQEDFRVHSLRLLRALLAQKGYVFTDLSPSGNVPALNERLGFHRLDTSTRLVANVPWPRRSRVHVTNDPRSLESTLEGRDAEVYRDHRSARASRHLLVQAEEGYAYLLYRRDRRKRVAGFASPLFVGGDPRLLESAWAQVAAYMLRRGMFATLAERRVLGFTPRGIGRGLAHPRPKMFKGNGTDGTQIDYLYSELTLLEW